MKFLYFTRKKSRFALFLLVFTCTSKLKPTDLIGSYQILVTRRFYTKYHKSQFLFNFDNFWIMFLKILENSAQKLKHSKNFKQLIHIQNDQSPYPHATKTQSRNLYFSASFFHIVLVVINLRYTSALVSQLLTRMECVCYQLLR